MLCLPLCGCSAARVCLPFSTVGEEGRVAKKGRVVPSSGSHGICSEAARQRGSPGLGGRTAEGDDMIDSLQNDGQLSAQVCRGLHLLHTVMAAPGLPVVLARRQGPQALTRRHARSREPKEDDFAGARWAPPWSPFCSSWHGHQKSFTQPIAMPRLADGAVARSSDYCPVILCVRHQSSTWPPIPSMSRAPNPQCLDITLDVAGTEPHRDSRRRQAGGHGTSFVVDAAACMRPAAAHAGREPGA